MKRVLSILLVCSLLVCLCIPAGAVDVTGDFTHQATFGYNVSSTTSTPSITRTTGDIAFPRTGAMNVQYIAQNYGSSYITPSTYVNMSFLPVEFNLSYDAGSYYSGAVGVYLSFYYLFNLSASVFTGDEVTSGSLSAADDWQLVYLNEYGRDTLASVEVTTFNSVALAESTYAVDPVGIQLSFSMDVTDGSSIQPSYFLYSGGARTIAKQVSSGTTVTWSPAVIVPSSSVVVAETSADLAALENIADSIVAGNQILSAMYGDVMSVLNSIYQRTGDMLTAQNLTNQYLLSISNYLFQIENTTSQIYSILGTYMHYLQDIAETAEDIYSELQAFHTDFLLKLVELIQTVQTESDNIQAKMQELYNSLIAYLDSTFSSAVTDEGEEIRSEIDSSLDQQEQIETDVIGSMTSGINALDFGSVTLNDDIVSGLVFVSNLWTSFYNNAGPYQTVILLPLYVGVALLLIGGARKLMSQPFYTEDVDRAGNPIYRRQRRHHVRKKDAGGEE